MLLLHLVLALVLFCKRRKRILRQQISRTVLEKEGVVEIEEEKVYANPEEFSYADPSKADDHDLPLGTDKEPSNNPSIERARSEPSLHEPV